MPNVMTIFDEIKKVLPNFNAYFAPAEELKITYGLAIFVKKSIKINEHGDIFVFREKNSMIDDGKSLARNLQYIKFQYEGKNFTICNLHGLYTGGGKEDTESRIEQSNKIKFFLNKVIEPKILCGDFNLLPHTESLKILEKNMKNLIKEHDIKSTRSHFYTKEHKFADYILVSDEVNVKKFEVKNESVSDHLPLYLEFN